MIISICQNCLKKQNPVEYIVPPPLKVGTEQLVLDEYIEQILASKNTTEIL